MSPINFFKLTYEIQPPAKNGNPEKYQRLAGFYDAGHQPLFSTNILNSAKFLPYNSISEG
jgi:hypothetical protein